MDPYYRIDFNGLLPGEYDHTIKTRIKVHRRISKSLTYDMHNKGNKSFVDIIRERIYSPDDVDSPNPLNPKIASPTTISPKKTNNSSSSKKKIDRSSNSDKKISRIASFFNLDNDDIIHDPNKDDEEILNDISLELKNLNMYCDYSTPTHLKLAPLRVQEKALQKGISLASLVKQQLYYNPSNLSSSMRMSSSLPISSKKRPSTAEDSRRRYEARQKLKKNNNINIDIKYDPVYYKYYDELQHYDFLISIEYCSECHKHISLRHNDCQYENISKKSAEILLQVLIECKINARVGLIRVTPPVINAVVMNDKDDTVKTNDDIKSPSASSKKVLKRPASAPSTKSKANVNMNNITKDSNIINDVGSRVGALEIQVVFKDSKGMLHAKVIHSKLQSMTWPSKNKIIDNFKSFIQQQKKAGTISSYANDYLGAYDFLLLDDNDSPKKEQAVAEIAPPLKEQVQTCPLFENCTRGCRATTNDTADSITKAMASAVSSVNKIVWLSDTSAYAHNPDYANGDYVVVEIRQDDEKKTAEGYIMGRVIASHRDGSYSIKYKKMLWGKVSSDGYPLLSSSVLQECYLMDTNEDNSDNDGVIELILRRDLQDMYIKKGQKETKYHDDLVIRYINEHDIQRVYHLDTDTVLNIDTTNNTKITTNDSGFYDVNDKVETFSSKYQNILNVYDDNNSNSKKKKDTISNKINIEQEAYSFSFASP